MKKLISLSIFVGILLVLAIVSKSAEAQHVLVNRSTVVIASPSGSPLVVTNGYWKWSPRYQQYIWVVRPKARLRIHRGYRVRI